MHSISNTILAAACAAALAGTAQGRRLATAATSFVSPTQPRQAGGCQCAKRSSSAVHTPD